MCQNENILKRIVISIIIVVLILCETAFVNILIILEMIQNITDKAINSNRMVNDTLLG